mmetsp:Transcript_53060/g.151142  ORF Transcript_53060/g.151142 Transcript_53060/m.151142 type:complete len:222 (+) Transcript_53060:221-886(+)
MAETPLQRPIQCEAHGHYAQDHNPKIQHLLRPGLSAEPVVENRRINEGDGRAAQCAGERQELVEVVAALESNHAEDHDLRRAKGVLPPGVLTGLHHTEHPELGDARRGEEHQRQAKNQGKHVPDFHCNGQTTVVGQVQQHHGLHGASPREIAQEPKDGEEDGNGREQLGEERPEGIWVAHCTLDRQYHRDPFECKDCHADEYAEGAVLEGLDVWILNLLGE